MKIIKTDVDKIKSITHIYTDGGCKGNGKKENIGAYAFIVVKCLQIRKEYPFIDYDTTNNKMELKAIIAALGWIKIFLDKDEQVIIHSDSQYCIEGINNWSIKWKLKNFKDVKNPELWKELCSLADELPNVQYKWVKGHQESNSFEARFNNRVDELCNKLIQETI